MAIVVSGAKAPTLALCAMLAPALAAGADDTAGSPKRATWPSSGRVSVSSHRSTFDRESRLPSPRVVGARCTWRSRVTEAHGACGDCQPIAHAE